MSEDKRRFQIKKIYIIFMIFISVLLSVFILIEFNTSQTSVVPADCFLIQSDLFDIPSNAITKGYSMSKDVNGTIISTDCYYLKNAGIIERTLYGWSVYE